MLEGDFLNLITPVFYKNFKCIAGACPDSCCQGWEVDADSESLKYYETLTGDISDRIKNVLDKDEFGNTVFRLTSKKRCPFLNSENLCDMHIVIGGEHTPFTCRTFPRFINYYGSNKEMGISFSCPVAAEMMWNFKDDFTFDAVQIDEPPQLNDIDGMLYLKLIDARKKSYNIIIDKSVDIKIRLLKLLENAVLLQNEIEPYTDGFDNISFKEAFTNPEVINNEWVQKVNSSQFIPDIKNNKSNENIAMYFLFRYFLTAVYDYDVLSKIKMAIIGTLIPGFFGEDDWTIHLWSKETEHSDVNMNRYNNILKSADCFSVKNLKNILKKGE